MMSIIKDNEKKYWSNDYYSTLVGKIYSKVECPFYDEVSEDRGFYNCRTKQLFSFHNFLLGLKPLRCNICFLDLVYVCQKLKNIFNTIQNL